VAVGKCVLWMRGGWSWLRFVLNGELMLSYFEGPVFNTKDMRKETFISA
jgi:hypothetical protein